MVWANLRRTLLPHRRLVALAAALSMLMAALAPAVSAGWFAWRTVDSPWLVVCSAHNPLSSAAARALVGDAQDDSGEQTSPRCPVCLGHLADGAFAMPDLAFAAPPIIRPGLPRAFLQALVTAYPWTAPPSRGPPDLG